MSDHTRRGTGTTRLPPAVLLISLSAAGLAQEPAARAVEYLSREVQAWPRENHCFSCHNNGDGARALYAARAPAVALAETTQWLMRPLEWDNNRGDPGFSDKKLARIQFAAALAEAVQSGLVADRKILVQAAESLLPYQEADGSWQVDAGAEVGSPATYGARLATWLVHRTLQRAGVGQEARMRARRWLLAAPVKSTLDAAVATLAGSPRVDLLLRAQTKDGGWGPYPNSPAEVFDTAVVLLALHSQAGPASAVEGGRKFLAATQLPTGGWPETTRPPGGRSYAQHVSTTAWATLALLETEAKPNPK
ncbi:MAG: terpene cyclase/mutase family protein [Acidobacteria bacterium]|nr:terpene cyclase/mutase family protein [Acidobacteriota bacterium]